MRTSIPHTFIRCRLFVCMCVLCWVITPSHPPVFSIIVGPSTDSFVSRVGQLCRKREKPYGSNKLSWFHAPFALNRVKLEVQRAARVLVLGKMALTREQKQFSSPVKPEIWTTSSKIPSNFAFTFRQSGQFHLLPNLLANFRPANSESHSRLQLASPQFPRK